MALCTVHFSSKLLGKQVALTVLLPEQFEPPFATFYLLHGLSDDHTIWLRRTSIERYVIGYPLIVVMPDGYRGFYTDNDEGPAYARYIGEEMREFIERNFPAHATRNARCIGGLSMGGYGALRVGLGYPDRYASINSHSGALLHGQKTWSKNPEMRRIFGARAAGSDHDLLHLARRVKAHGREAHATLPKIRIDCGVDDFLIEDNRQFHAALEKLKILHEYEEAAGEHNWDYWDLHVQDALRFHAHALRLPARST